VSSLVDGRLLRIDQVASIGRNGPTGSLRIELEWPPDAGPQVTVTGELPSDEQSEYRGTVNATVDATPPLRNIRHEQLWLALVAHASKLGVDELRRRKTEAGCLVLPTAFDGLPEAARRTFQTDLAIPATTWQELGQFEPTVLTNVPLVPATERDAQTWLEWLQWQALGDYATIEQLTDTGQRLAAEHFPLHHPRPLLPEQLLATAKQLPRADKAWYLLAPHDLGLWSPR
jgi:hypothetical protein